MPWMAVATRTSCFAAPAPSPNRSASPAAPDRYPSRRYEALRSSSARYASRLAPMDCHIRCRSENPDSTCSSGSPDGSSGYSQAPSSWSAEAATSNMRSMIRSAAQHRCEADHTQQQENRRDPASRGGDPSVEVGQPGAVLLPPAVHRVEERALEL